MTLRAVLALCLLALPVRAEVWRGEPLQIIERLAEYERTETSGRYRSASTDDVIVDAYALEYGLQRLQMRSVLMRNIDRFHEEYRTLYFETFPEDAVPGSWREGPWIAVPFATAVQSRATSEAFPPLCGWLVAYPNGGKTFIVRLEHGQVEEVVQRLLPDLAATFGSLGAAECGPRFS